jgi:hypothetical protein
MNWLEPLETMATYKPHDWISAAEVDVRVLATEVVAALNTLVIVQVRDKHPTDDLWQTGLYHYVIVKHRGVCYFCVAGDASWARRALRLKNYVSLKLSALEQSYSRASVGLATVLRDTLEERGWAEGVDLEISPLRGDGHGLNFLVEDPEGGWTRRVIITEP